MEVVLTSGAADAVAGAIVPDVDCPSRSRPTIPPAIAPATAAAKTIGNVSLRLGFMKDPGS